MFKKVSDFQVNGWAVIGALVFCIVFVTFARLDCRKPTSKPAPAVKQAEAKSADLAPFAEQNAQKDDPKAAKHKRGYLSQGKDEITGLKRFLMCIDQDGTYQEGDGVGAVCVRVNGEQGDVYFRLPLDPMHDFLTNRGTMDIRYEVKGKVVVRSIPIGPADVVGAAQAFVADQEKGAEFVNMLSKAKKITVRVRLIDGSVYVMSYTSENFWNEV